MSQKEETFYKSPIGYIKITAGNKGITGIDFIKGKSKIKPSKTSNVLLQSCIKQLDEYFQGKREKFELIINLYGTEFQKKVWLELLKIPFGQTLSYAEIAKRIKNPKAVRAVGQAIGRNPISIVVPCHRVIGKNGKLTGYASGLDRKKWLLEHEGIL